jgi:hypothetical protein
VERRRICTGHPQAVHRFSTLQAVAVDAFGSIVERMACVKFVLWKT